MKNYQNLAVFLILTILSSTLSCSSQNKNPEEKILTISPNINQKISANNEIIAVLDDFFETKNNSVLENKFWLPSDFQKYKYPFLDLYNIENSKHGKNFFKPTLMEILPTENSNQKILKIAFIGHHHETNQNQIKAIYNLVSENNSGNIKLSRYLNLATKNWQKHSTKSVNYYISPNKKANQTEMFLQQKDIDFICTFFETKPIEITYFSCINPKELFEIKGFDYHPMMYIDSSGGFADHGNIIFSGNDSEIYTHEIVHIYMRNLFPEINSFLDEGIATYIAGSGKFDYQWHREKIKKLLTKNPTFDFASQTDIYARNYFENETPLPYLTAALVIEHTLRHFGKNALIDLLNSKTDLWTSLNKVGLTKENFNEKLRKEINKPIHSIR
ncbi:hypothetical protein GV828_02600 [Flavobacterium sp. NST-5]|uniref:Peptidase MA-like domain-containing protein n=1 Tax=Flavobacterium ichthyis TaxID=2698827 RepID=A0ABW9Z694_9FLAO|nr:hypothetical protein [Flavobacterium ichthyis]NBL64087.1 hypothetical protein [Flavobacterium ichthyis]